MNLYSRRKFLASAVLLLVCVCTITAAIAQRRKAHKLRATAVAEITTDSSGVVTTRITPVTVLDEGHFQDASIYKASPRPMAIENGIVYEAQAAGTPVGYATVSNSANQNGWMALGKWKPIDLNKNDLTKKTETAATAPAATGDERPILRKGSGTEASAPVNPPTPSATSAPASPTTTPTVSAPSASGDAQSAAPSLPADADRPTLRRKTEEKQAEAGTPPAAGASKPVSQPASAAPRVRTPMIVPGTKTFAAVSDAEPIETRSFEFKWKSGEEQQMESRMRKLALAQLPRDSAHLTPDSLTNVVMRSFDLDMSNDAVMVLSAEIPASTPAPGGKTAPARPVTRYVTVIARVDFEGLPQRLLASVTDSTRLDVTPRLELIDAIDVDGDGVAEILFREYSFDQKSYIVYGVGRSTATKLFEGAGAPLR